MRAQQTLMSDILTKILTHQVGNACFHRGLVTTSFEFSFVKVLVTEHKSYCWSACQRTENILILLFGHLLSQFVTVQDVIMATYSHKTLYMPPYCYVGNNDECAGMTARLSGPQTRADKDPAPIPPLVLLVTGSAWSPGRGGGGDGPLVGWSPG